MPNADLTTYNWKLRYSRESDNLLESFYIPALQRSVRYDRKAGFFSSTALSAAARGIACLIENGGTMRLLVSARLSRNDVRAINEGYDLRQRIQERALEQWEHPEERIERERLEALAWMIARGTLEIKVAVPVDEDGTLQDVAEDELFHEKVGIFTDAHGNRVAFSGSNNESHRGWLKNRESFNAFWSWRAGDEERIEGELTEFELLWEDRAKHTRVVDFPLAVKQKIIELAPEEPPVRDPEDPEIAGERERQLEREKWLFQFVRDAPYMPNGELLAEEFATVDLWPHQRKVSDQIVETYPEPYLLCDEVGLGKTIEAGISLKRLLLTGRVKRVLLLVPASLVTQWQEELVEKFNLNTWQYTGGGFVDAHGNEMRQDPENPWNTCDVIIASSHLAKRRERMPALLAANEWDLVLVDEAHHARRGEPTSDDYRPNQMLELLQQIRPRARGMLLLTATPMQLDPIEIWDLMEAMGLGGKWGALGGELFKRYFNELRLFPDHADTDFICEMLHDYLQHIDGWDHAAEALARRTLGIIKLQELKTMAEQGRCGTSLRRWGDDDLAAAVQFFRAHTPLHHYVFRHTRDLLRDYRQQGLLDKNIADRDVEDRFIEFSTGEERELYDRIEKYIRDVYVAADQQNRSGVGFVMTIYRRRLTSSFYAIQRSLERRLKHLLGEEDGGRGGLTDEDIEEEDLDSDIRDELEGQDEPIAMNVTEEIAYVQQFLQDIEHCATDTKFDKFRDDLEAAFKTHQTVVVFTQYGDTLDYIREQLLPVYGRQVACYSGRGGERWDGEKWVGVSKEKIKALFASGEDVKLLLCTEAASEGLNLQTCSMLMNYDMPWNPMKVEQRIGRIDRIGQEAEQVEVINYYYEDTVEARIHQRLGQRIGSFIWVVGPLQPILAQLPKLTRDVAFADPAERDQRIMQIVEALGEQYEILKREALNLEEMARHTSPEERGPTPSPVRPQDLEELFIGSELIDGGRRFEEVKPGLYRLSGMQENGAVTFLPNVYDVHPDSASFLAYGSDAFSELIDNLPSPEEKGAPVTRIEVEADGERLVQYCVTDDGSLHRLASLAALRSALDAPQSPGRAAGADSATSSLRSDLERLLRQRQDAEGQQRQRYLEGRLATLRRDALASLEALMAIDFARSHGSLDNEIESSERIGVRPLLQKRAGDIPFPALMAVAGASANEVTVEARTIRQFIGKKRESLNASWGRQLRRSNDVVAEWRRVKEGLDSAS